MENLRQQCTGGRINSHGGTLNNKGISAVPFRKKPDALAARGRDREDVRVWHVHNPDDRGLRRDVEGRHLSGHAAPRRRGLHASRHLLVHRVGQLQHVASRLDAPHVHAAPVHAELLREDHEASGRVFVAQVVGGVDLHEAQVYGLAHRHGEGAGAVRTISRRSRRRLFRPVFGGTFVEHSALRDHGGWRDSEHDVGHGHRHDPVDLLDSVPRTEEGPQRAHDREPARGRDLGEVPARGFVPPVLRLADRFAQCPGPREAPVVRCHHVYPRDEPLGVEFCNGSVRGAVEDDGMRARVGNQVGRELRQAAPRHRPGEVWPAAATSASLGTFVGRRRDGIVAALVVRVRQHDEPVLADALTVPTLRSRRVDGTHLQVDIKSGPKFVPLSLQQPQERHADLRVAPDDAHPHVGVT
mmetsp:Transcript_17186/g.34220  ORF Transcript_17186/g.34220 Transcript_17186/m.34220 type:complete len:412 (-) Transcript_17186:2316-3551(-)